MESIILSKMTQTQEKKGQKQYIASYVETSSCNICLRVFVYIYKSGTNVGKT